MNRWWIYICSYYWLKALKRSRTILRIRLISMTWFPTCASRSSMRMTNCLCSGACSSFHRSKLRSSEARRYTRMLLTPASSIWTTAAKMRTPTIYFKACFWRFIRTILSCKGLEARMCSKSSRIDPDCSINPKSIARLTLSALTKK